jgi:hypothetical protein
LSVFSSVANTSSRSSLKPVPARKSKTRRERNSDTIWLVLSVSVSRRALGMSRQTLRRSTSSP